MPRPTNIEQALPILSWHIRQETEDPDKASIQSMWILWRLTEPRSDKETSPFHELSRFYMHTSLNGDEERAVHYEADDTRRSAVIKKAISTVCKKVFEDRIRMQDGEKWEHNIIKNAKDSARAIFVWENTNTGNKGSMDVVVKYNPTDLTATSKLIAYSVNELGYQISQVRMMESMLQPEDT